MMQVWTSTCYLTAAIKIKDPISSLNISSAFLTQPDASCQIRRKKTSIEVMFVKLGAYLLPRTSLSSIESVSLVDSRHQRNRRRTGRNRRCRAATRNRFTINLVLKNQTESIVLAESNRKVALDRLMRKICKKINQYIGQDEDETNERITELGARVQEIYNAPGMPGYEMARNEWENLTLPTASPAADE